MTDSPDHETSDGKCEDLVVESGTLSPSDLTEPYAVSEEMSSTFCLTYSLETLPTEIRINILLHMPNLPTLRSMVRASPVMHAQYRCYRNSILTTCLERELVGFKVDAIAYMKSRVQELGSPRTDEKITEFLGRYKESLAGQLSFPDLSSLDPSSTRWMAAYHLSVARPLCQRYCQWALANLAEASSFGTEETTFDPQAISVSRSEEIRVFRALYRYDTYHHLFGRNKGQRYGGFRHHEISELFFGKFDPWESEAIGCIELFVREKYEIIFDQVKDDLHHLNPRFRQPNGVINPEGSFDLIDERNDYMNGTISRGLKLTVRLLAVTNHADLVTRMERCLTHDENLDAPMRQVLGVVAQDDRRELSNTANDANEQAQQARKPMRFLGDALPLIGPPYAWVKAWGGVFSNIYGEFVPKALRKWGYVMWDMHRCLAKGADRLIVAQWHDEPELVTTIKDMYDWSPLRSSPAPGSSS